MYITARDPPKTFRARAPGPGRSAMRLRCSNRIYWWIAFVAWSLNWRRYEGVPFSAAPL